MQTPERSPLATTLRCILHKNHWSSARRQFDYYTCAYFFYTQALIPGPNLFFFVFADELLSNCSHPIMNCLCYAHTFYTTTTTFLSSSPTHLPHHPSFFFVYKLQYCNVLFVRCCHNSLLSKQFCHLPSNIFTQ